MELLLNCARQTMPPEIVASTRMLLERQQPWDALVPLAWRHGVASLLYRNLEGFAADGLVPRAAQRRLYLLYEKTSYQNRRLLRTLGQVLDLFAEHRIPVLTLKGAFLAQQIYGDVSLRPFLDLDLLIDRRDYPRTRKLLLGEGFELAGGILSERLCWEYHFNLPFVSKNEVVVELHWNLIDTFSCHVLDVAAFWSRAEHTSLCGRSARVLCLEDLITHLACHLAMHGYVNEAIVGEPEAARWVLHPLSENRLIWFTDLYEVIAAHRCRIDWGRLIAGARASGADVPVGATLALLNRLFGTVIEPDVLSQLRSPRPRFLQRRLFNRLKSEMSGAAADATPRGYFANVLLPKRKDVQFRLIRLFHVWDYIFPRVEAVESASEKIHGARIVQRAYVAAAYLAHATKASGRCMRLGARIVFHRLMRSMFAAQGSGR